MRCTTALIELTKIVGNATKFIAPRAEKWAKMYKDEKLIYTMGSGSAYSVAYSFAICLLMEMQWINSSAIHSGEYFHGPFEITDRETPFIVFMSEGRTRPLDQRALDFLKQYAEKLMIVDVKSWASTPLTIKLLSSLTRCCSFMRSAFLLRSCLRRESIR